MFSTNGSPYGKNKIVSYTVYKHMFQMDKETKFLKEKNTKALKMQKLLIGQSFLSKTQDVETIQKRLSVIKNKNPNFKQNSKRS